MSRMIKAMFDSTDMAEFAMMRVKRNGINVEAYDVEPTSKLAGNGSVSQIVFPYNADYGFGPDALHPEMERVLPFGGVLYTTGYDNVPDRRTLDDDIYSSEVKMSIKVPDDQADTTEAILRSCHGYNIRTL